VRLKANDVLPLQRLVSIVVTNRPNKTTWHSKTSQNLRPCLYIRAYPHGLLRPP